MNSPTEKAIQDAMYFSSYGFLDEIEDRLEELGMQRKDLARKVDVTEGRISQIFRNPGNLTLKLVAKIAHAVDLKISLVPYEASQLLHPQVFTHCWRTCGRPQGVAPKTEGFFCIQGGKNEEPPASWESDDGRLDEIELAVASSK
jgi:transcriptional regulator with XRE-family HTH domain